MDLLKCNRCGKGYSVRSMFADVSGKGLVCHNCFQLIKNVRTDADKLIQRRITSAESVKAKKGKEVERARRIKEGKEYVCRACNYRFISSLLVKKCPYCSEENKLTVVEQVVSEIDDLMKRHP